MIYICNLCETKVSSLIGYVQHDQNKVEIVECLKVFNSDLLKYIDINAKCCCHCGEQLKTAYNFAQKLRVLMLTKMNSTTKQLQNELTTHQVITFGKSHIKPEENLVICSEEDIIQTKHHSSTKMRSKVEASSQMTAGLAHYALDSTIEDKTNSLCFILPKRGNSIHLQQGKSTRSSRPRVYKCKECCKEFNSFSKMNTHKAAHLIHDTCPNVCDKCFKLFTSEAEKAEHCLVSHINGRFQCPLCDKEFKTDHYVMRHVNRIHNMTTIPYCCSICNKTEFNKETIKTHAEEVHSKPLSMVNEKVEHIDEDTDDMDMDVEFLDELQLDGSFSFMENWYDKLSFELPVAAASTNHVLEHEKSLFSCSQCIWKCNKATQLLLHMTTAQHHIKILICSDCQEKFETQDEFNEHTKRKYLEPMDVVIQACGLSLPKYECPFNSCSKLFGARSYLLQHLRVIHINIKRHVCYLCEKEFATQDHLRKHVLSLHQNERKHICHVCAKRYTQHCHLKKHMLEHDKHKDVTSAYD